MPPARGLVLWLVRGGEAAHTCMCKSVFCARAAPTVRMRARHCKCKYVCARGRTHGITLLPTRIYTCALTQVWWWADWCCCACCAAAAEQEQDVVVTLVSFSPEQFKVHSCHTECGQRAMLRGCRTCGLGATGARRAGTRLRPRWCRAVVESGLDSRNALRNTLGTRRAVVDSGA